MAEALVASLSAPFQPERFRDDYREQVIDLIERKSCRLDSVEITTLDEADYMADLGFLPQVDRRYGKALAEASDGVHEAGEKKDLAAAKADGLENYARYQADAGEHGERRAADQHHQSDQRRH